MVKGNVVKINEEIYMEEMYFLESLWDCAHEYFEKNPVKLDEIVKKYAEEKHKEMENTIKYSTARSLMKCKLGARILEYNIDFNNKNLIFKSIKLIEGSNFVELNEEWWSQIFSCLEKKEKVYI